MDFELTREHQAWLEEVRAFLDQSFGPDAMGVEDLGPVDQIGGGERLAQDGDQSRPVGSPVGGGGKARVRSQLGAAQRGHHGAQ